MIDIHCHLIPAFPNDDGAPDAKTFEGMLQDAKNDGITTIIATPHGSQEGEAVLAERVAAAAPIAAEHGIRLLAGMEYRFLRLNLTKERSLRTLNGTKYLLIDFDSPNLPPALPGLAYDLVGAGYRLICAHPERMFRMEDVLRLEELGFYIQLTATALLGDWGAEAKRVSMECLERGLCHFIASDAHNRKRGFHMTRARAMVERHFGSEIAELLFKRNPALLLEGRLPEHMPMRRLSFWERMRFRFDNQS